ncbi:MAG: autotransporter-associated beta strand repeat-containing protein [Verrucomicrobiota bacterium]|nr:autotransporter-associated beta strand repeat-containing protein [Verrucomicrobiota bacterium]
MSADISNGTTGNSIAVLKSSSGTVTFSGTNTYSGATTVNGGTLLINGDQSGARGNVAVNKSGSILGGVGTIGGRVTINSGATITGGAIGTVGTLTLNNSLSFFSGTYLVDLSGAASDKLAITGLLNLTGGATLTFSGSVDGISSYVLATYSDGHTGEFTASNLPADYSLIYGPNELDLVPLAAAPEPATWVGAMLGLAAIIVSRRRFSQRRLT